MVLNQELASLKLFRVHAIKQHLLPTLFPQVFSIEFGSHVAPDFGTLHFGDMAVLGEIHPVRFVEFGSDQEIEIVNLVIFSNECSCKRFAY